jgi:hypothetical protein
MRDEEATPVETLLVLPTETCTSENVLPSAPSPSSTPTQCHTLQFALSTSPTIDTKPKQEFQDCPRRLDNIGAHTEQNILGVEIEQYDQALVCESDGCPLSPSDFPQSEEIFSGCNDSRTSNNSRFKLDINGSVLEYDTAVVDILQKSPGSSVSSGDKTMSFLSVMETDCKTSLRDIETVSTQGEGDAKGTHFQSAMNAQQKVTITSGSLSEPDFIPTSENSSSSLSFLETLT